MFAQRFDAAGTPQGLEFQVNESDDGNQYRPSAAMADDGSFAVGFQNSDLGEMEFDVFMGLFTSQGEGIQEHALNTHTESEQDQVAVAAAGTRGYVAVWSSLFQDGDGDGVYARRYLVGPDGVDAAEFMVPDSPAGWQSAPAVGANEEIVVMVWQQTGAMGDFELWVKVLPVSESSPSL